MAWNAEQRQRYRPDTSSPDYRRRKRASAKSQYERNPEKFRTRVKARRDQMDPLLRIVKRALQDRRGKGFSATADALVAHLSPAPTHCPVFGMELDYHPKIGQST